MPPAPWVETVGLGISDGARAAGRALTLDETLELAGFRAQSAERAQRAELLQVTFLMVGRLRSR
jgi:hypothetical protein